MENKKHHKLRILAAGDIHGDVDLAKKLAERAKKIDLGSFLLFGKGEMKQDGYKNPTNVANALEALIGAVYLDSDMSTVRNFIINIFPDPFM